MNQANTHQQSASASVATRSAQTRLSGVFLLIVRTVWLVLVVPSLALFVVGLPLYYQRLQQACVDPVTCNFVGTLTAKGLQELPALGFSASGYAAFNTIFWGIIVAVWSGIGFLLFWRRSDDGMALFAAFALLMFNSTYPGLSITVLSITYPALALPVVLISFLGQVSITLFFLLFPNGRLTPRWSGLIILLVLIQTVSLVVPPTSPVSQNIWSVWINGFLTLTIYGSIIVSQIYRYQRVSTAVERQQTKWVVFGILIVAVGFIAFGFIFNVLFPTLAQPNSPYYLFAGLIYPLVLLLIPVSVGVAILRYRLWDIDLIINRTLVYGLLSACVVGFYVLVVGYLGAVFHTGSNLVISLLATGLVAVLFQPLRALLQRAVNRLLYGQRDEPYRVISQLGQRLEATVAPDAILPVIVETVAQALKLPYAAIALKSFSAPNSVRASEAAMQGSLLKQDEEFAIAAAYLAKTGGASLADALPPRPETLLHLPLLYQSEQVGELLLAPRARSETFTPADHRLLEDLARQIGIAAHAVRLTAALQQSRERLVTAREEERRRLRRDLHDGLGPTLAALNLQAGAVRALIRQDPAEATALVTEWRTTLRAVIADIRRLVYDLRPPALDELGLIGALREQCAQYSTQAGTNGVQMVLEVPDRLPPLPAAVEVAACRIALEAITNVARHAQARTCHVRLWLDDALHLKITDDGMGLSEEHRTGVGMLSMRERAEELGGSCRIEPALPRGTRVYARLPLPKE